MKFLSIIKTVLMCISLQATGVTLLIKIPTRSRPEKFFATLDKFYAYLSGNVDCAFLITCDIDDITMNNDAVRHKFSTYSNLYYSYSTNSSKVEAYNKDLGDYNFKIVVLAADDMEPAVVGYDKIIIQSMLKNFPDFDGVLNFNDGHVGEQCNTVPIIGKKFYDRFGYAYNPIYKALFCDSELTHVSRDLGKEAVFNEVVIKHNHPVFQAKPVYDALYQRNDAFWNHDQAVFQQRLANNFDLALLQAQRNTEKEWSILICTLDDRAESFGVLYNELKRQISENDLNDKIEVLYFKDNRENTIGFKRNYLLQQSKGLYVNFLDDDDKVHPNYIKMIYERIQKRPDCVSLTGVITFNGKNPQKFIHSIKYATFFEKNDIFYRPPNHLNTMKRSIAAQFIFPETNFGEDAGWAIKIAHSGLLKNEEEINEPYYFYLFTTRKEVGKFKEIYSFSNNKACFDKNKKLSHHAGKHRSLKDALQNIRKKRCMY